MPNCAEPAKWVCVQSGFRYCEKHKKPHGTDLDVSGAYKKPHTWKPFKPTEN